MKEQPTTPPTEAPEQPTLPGMEAVRTASVSDRPPSPEDLAQENAQLKSELHMRTAVYDIESRLAKAGARTPNLIAESAKGSFQFDDEGKLTNAEAILDDLKRRYPEQFAPATLPSIDASAGRTQRPAITKEALARMTPDEIRRLDWAEVRAALAS
jgi:hypothetical protein